jgi:hypothetical protein
MLGRTCKRLGYAVGVLTALGTGPALIPFFINTDPIINIYSQTPDVEPISGWYGPGAWLAYTLTTLNALRHHFALSWHMVVDHTDSDEVKCAHCPREDWDADWLVSLVYTSFSSADLIRRSIAIIKADKLVGIQDLPAIRAAATAVYIGSGASDLALVSMILVAYMRRKESGFLKSMGLLRWRLLLTVGTLNIIGLLGVVIHQKAIRTQNLFMSDAEQKERQHLSVGLLELYGLRSLAFDGGIIKVLAMLPLEMPWWAIIYGVMFWGGIVYMMIWREAPRLDLKTLIRIVVTILVLWFYLPVTVPALSYLVTVSSSFTLPVVM